MEKRLLLLGAGGHGKVVREVALSLLNIDGTSVYESVDFLDDNSKDAIGKIADLENIKINTPMYSAELAITQLESSYWIRLSS